MSFKIEIVRDEDFPEVIAAEWEAFENPLEGIFRLYAPIIDNDRPASLAEHTAAQFKIYKGQQAEGVWIKVVDTDAGNKIAGGAKWTFYKENPFASPTEEPSVADRHPEGGARIFATLALEQLYAPRREKGQRPHASLDSCFTVPAYRRRGVGGMLMRWGLQRADELGLESWIDATAQGAPFYERHGCTRVVQSNLAPRRPGDLSEKEAVEWEDTEKSILPVDFTVMWRPAGGDYVEGQSVKPWEVLD